MDISSTYPRGSKVSLERLLIDRISPMPIEQARPSPPSKTKNPALAQRSSTVKVKQIKSNQKSKQLITFSGSGLWLRPVDRSVSSNWSISIRNASVLSCKSISSFCLISSRSLSLSKESSHFCLSTVRHFSSSKFSSFKECSTGSRTTSYCRLKINRDVYKSEC